MNMHSASGVINNPEIGTIANRIKRSETISLKSDQEYQQPPYQSLYIADPDISESALVPSEAKLSHKFDASIYSAYFHSRGSIATNSSRRRCRHLYGAPRGTGPAGAGSQPARGRLEATTDHRR